ncbi:MAG: tetratricopeptide repeat-containing sulfotransferase family protein [Steroidobacteraceae bacterium]|jgi:tetratricopeptide (TPR) repeat protein
MPAAALNPPKSSIEMEVLGIRGLLEKSQFAQALAAAEALLAKVPENRDVWYMLAVAQRYLGRIPEALATLERFETIHPDYSRLFQERGHCCVAARDPVAAIDAYLRAVNLNPALPASWQALQILFRSSGQVADAETAAAHVAKLASLPLPIVTASSMFADGEIHEAERVVRQFLQTHGDHIEAMRLLAQIGMKLDVLDDAEFLLESVLVFDPDYHLARYDYVGVLLRLHKHAKALEEIATLLKVEPQNRAYRICYANVCVGLGNHEEGLRVFRELSAEAPLQADLHLSIAHALKTLGKQQQSIESYRAAAAVKPSFGDAYWSLANLKTYRFTDEEIARMRAQEAAPATKLVDRYHLCFALGKAFEDSAQYAESFRYYERGNALKKSESRYRPGPVERNARLQAAVCTREFFTARQGVGCDRTDPIFIVGLPRAGSTLIEQILASHSKVEGTMELADIPRLVQHLQGRDPDDSKPRYPGVLADLSADQLKRFGEKYIADTQVYRSGKRFFIDKNPNNFRHIGLIHLMLPNAKIIDARREPMACCFSNFKQLFAAGQEFTYSLEDIGRYYRSYVELMAHWERILPGKILRVQHEDVVEDLEGDVRRILDFCGLEYEPQCVEFYKTERSVRTASSEQVRQPIFREGLDQWRNFEPFLGPLKAALGSSAAT